MIITISHQKGGVGKSTICFNMAVWLMKKYKIKVVDLDVQHTITATNNVRVQNSLKPLDIVYINNETDFKEIVDNDSDDIITIIDSGGFDSSLNRLAVFYSDFIITPVSDKFNEITGLLKYKEILKELKDISKEDIKVNVLLNNINPNAKNFDGIQQFIKQNEEFVMLETILRSRIDYDKAAWLGNSVKELDTKSKATKEFKAFIKEVMSRVGLK